MSRLLLEGSQAIARSMIAAGCRFFAGYPMTPFTEVLEHMAAELPGVGGVCVNAESELEAIGIAWGAAATGVRAATGSTGQGLSLMQESLSEMTAARVPLVVLNMARGQGDLLPGDPGRGHGDYRLPVLAPMDVTEAAELMPVAFEWADRWRNPVLFMGDYFIAHTYQSVDIDALPIAPEPVKDWGARRHVRGRGHRQARLSAGHLQAARRRRI